MDAPLLHREAMDAVGATICRCTEKAWCMPIS